MILGQYCMAEQLSHPLSGHGHRADPQVEVELGRDKKTLFTLPSTWHNW